MINAQLIYRSTDPTAVKWFTDAMQKRSADEQILREFQDKINLVFGSIGPRTRELRVAFDLIVGVEMANINEPAPDYWMHDYTIGGFVPDTGTDTGRQWQREIDALPPSSDLLDIRDIGMVGDVEFSDGQRTGHIHPSIHLSIEGGTLFALWEVRDVKQVVDKAIQDLGRGSWTEMKRSEWYTRVEYFEDAGL